MFADASTLISLDVVVCTYNRAADLDRVLAALACQEPTENVDWSVLVVDNASTDTTAEVVEAWRVRGGLPRLRRVLETEQGLSPARLRGVQETTAEWIAFVDDDNLLAPDWIRALGRAIAARPHAGGFGGRVVIDWGREPPRYFRSFGWCFAEQDYGAAERALESLVGAGMVLRRQALLASGWTEGPLLADRVGTRLVSGGDVEITQRVLGSGYELWYAPECILRHRIPPERITRRYLMRVAYGLGAGAAAVSALMWRQSYAEWLRDAKHKRRRFALQALRWIDPSPPRHIAPSAALVDIAFAMGFARGMAVARARFRAP